MTHTGRGARKHSIMRKIAIYGKGGIGKSTTVSNLSVALSALGLKVLQFGCDPKADSTKNLLSGKKIDTVLEVLKNKGPRTTLDDVIVTGSGGVLCVEAGGPTPGTGCAGRGIITAFEKLETLRAFEIYRPDIVLYDVLGDVVCGGFAAPIRNGYARDVFVVSSGEMMSLYAADNIAKAVRNFGVRGYARLGGLILNSRNVKDELSIVQRAAAEMAMEIIEVIPRCGLVQDAENMGKTVVDAFPQSEMARQYLRLAELMLSRTEVIGKVAI